MLEFARLPLDQRVPYFQEVANRRGLTRLIVEKDFWVCFSLRLLFSTPALADKFVFKGGTSLSKVFGIIKRFSEDIDLSVDPDWLGFGGENRQDAAKSRSQFEKRWKKLNDACAAAVDEKVRPTLEKAIQDTLGPAPDLAHYLAFKLDEQTHSPVLTFRYPTTEPARPGYVHPQVKLELGSLTDQRPIGNHTVTPWVAEEFPALCAAPACRVVALGSNGPSGRRQPSCTPNTTVRRISPCAADSRDCYDVMLQWRASRRPESHGRPRPARARRATQAHLLPVCLGKLRCRQTRLLAACAGRFPSRRPEGRLPADAGNVHRSPPPFDEILRQLRNIEDTLNKG